MSSLFHLLATPVILFISIPLAIFAAFTTTLAISTLSFRAFLVYFDLASAVLHDWLHAHTHTHTHTSPHPPSPLKPIPTPEKPPCRSRRKSRRSSAASFSSTTTTASSISPPNLPFPTAGFGIYTSTSAATIRDFEGVGGWRIPDPDDDNNDDESWTGLNSRLELPLMVDGRNRHHHRSRTLGSNVTSVSVPPKSPGLGGAKTPTGGGSGRSGGEWSAADGYFACENRRTGSKSTTSLADPTANIGKVILRHKPSSSSSGSSTQGSTRTWHLTLPNG